MYWTKTLIPTMKETPEGAEIPSHVLMLRAGLVNQVMAGAYTYLPLGFRALKKAEQIVREEMDAAGAVELAMPAISPRGLWERTGRVEAFGDVLVQLSLQRTGRKVHVVLGPTHEEIITDMVSRQISSYRQMPITLYQITAKFRNEERPRFGVLRTSEFLMKDAYSFNPSVESLGESYDKMYAAYCRIFDRCGLNYLVVEAESGPIGGDASHEFMIPAENGEDAVLHCRECGYAANREKAEIGARDFAPSEVPLAPLEQVATPGASTIEQVSGFLKCRPADLIKTLIYLADGKPIAVLVRGDHEANEGKIRRACLAVAGTAACIQKLELASPEVINKVTGAPVGFAGPVGMKEKIPILADRDVERMVNAATGANAADAHLTGVNSPRDFQPHSLADLRNAVDGDPCPRCNSNLTLRQAIEVGHVFKLGTKYSEALGARFLDAEEKLHPIIMGCYGIGVNRIIAGLIETSHDRDGIIWPVSLAPYEVLIVPVKVPDEALMKVAERLHEQLAAAGIDVLLDDRDCRAGVKFKDADLIGVPLRVVIGQRGLQEGKLEIKWRWDKESEQIDLDGAAETLAELIRAERTEATRFRGR
ncbi:MAG: proline--tRNA ligase [Planctomycetes bacterium]|nr:proline--tRNA ligase [Planctomycetota bacterium]MBU4400027.1 proline--tRNA ligase [Planctomycetota bacterium]MCG2682773.1 proline--tRNA ligase [Planctomycetales bacterium]